MFATHDNAGRPLVSSGMQNEALVPGGVDPAVVERTMSSAIEVQIAALIVRLRWIWADSNRSLSDSNRATVPSVYGTHQACSLAGDEGNQNCGSRDAYRSQTPTGRIICN